MKPGEPLDPSNPAMRAPPASERAPDPPCGAESIDRDDEERVWIARARGGDRMAFARLVDRHRDRAYGLALRIVHQSEAAEEVAQDAFVRVWRALPAFRGEARFSTWLHRIVVRRAIDRARVLRAQQVREAPLEQAPEPCTAGDGAGELGARDRRARLERLMAGLSEAQRAVVTLYYLADRSVEEVATTLGLPPNTVKTHLSRARAALRASWEAEETR